MRAPPCAGGGTANAKELDPELELQKRVGMGGIEMTPVAIPSEYSDNGEKAPIWMSDEWIDLLI